MATEIFHARDVTIKAIASSSVTISTNTLASYFTSGVTLAKVKEVSVTRGDYSFDQVTYHGEDSNGFQYQAKKRSPIGPAEVKITLDNDNYKLLAATCYDTSATINTSWVRYTDGNSVTRKNVSILMVADDGTDYCAFVADKSELVSTEDSSTGSDGNLEKSMTFRCLAKDLYGPEFK